MAVTVRGQKQTQNSQPVWEVPSPPPLPLPSVGLGEGHGAELRGWVWQGIGGTSGPKGFQGTL